MKNIIDYFKEKSYYINPDFYKAMDLWESYYMGSGENFQDYTQYNGVKMVKRKRKTLNMAKKICEDKADLLLNEKVEITLADDKSQKFLLDILKENDFYTNSNRLIEISNALGTGAFVEFFDGEKIVIDTISGKNIFPLSYDDDKIMECAFCSNKYFNGEKYIYINKHLLENGKYIIKNTALKYEDGKLVKTNILNKLRILEKVYTDSEKPFFQIIRPNTVNHLGLAPMGVSTFSTAIDLLQGIDIIYDSFINEFELGKKRIFIDSSLAQISISGEGTRLSPVFDTNDICFYGLNGLKESGELIKEVNMSLRIDEHIQAINTSLNLLSGKCGLGGNYYSFEKTGLKTATEVISENSDLYRKIKKDEIPLEKALKDIFEIIIYMGNKYLNGNYNSQGLSINFDDSIIEDTQKIKDTALKEREAGIISDERYLMETRNLEKESAKKLIKERDEIK